MTAPFQEKSAIGSLLITLVAFGYYIHATLTSPLSRGDTIALIIGVVVLVVIAEVIYHVLIAVSGETETDERDLLIDARAERFASFALATGVIGTIWHALSHEPSTTTVHLLVVSLAVAEVIKRISQIVYYRRGVPVA
jgi:hypothetical protein